MDLAEVLGKKMGCSLRLDRVVGDGDRAKMG